MHKKTKYFFLTTLINADLKMPLQLTLLQNRLDICLQYDLKSGLNADNHNTGATIKTEYINGLQNSIEIISESTSLLKNFKLPKAHIKTSVRNVYL